jgi:hypothetical protein
MPIRDDQHEALRDALVAAFPKVSDFCNEIGAGLQIDVEVEVGRQGGTRDIAWDMIRWAKARGRVDALFEAARERRPGNGHLAAFAAHIGRATVRGRETALQTSSFDLENLEQHCRDLLDGQLHRGLRVLLAAGAEQVVFDCLTERLRPLIHRTPGSAPPDTVVALDPRVANIDKEIARVKALVDKTATRHVFVKVHAAEASSAALTTFLGGVRANVPAKLAHDLVLLIRAAAELDPPLPPDLGALLPRPSFEDRHLYIWVERVSDGQQWSEDLKAAFKAALAHLARAQPGSGTSDFYDAINEAIDCLRSNPDQSTLNDWIAEQLTR